ncbi:hypothetical protein SNK05_003391 [Fusarium graminearum]
MPAIARKLLICAAIDGLVIQPLSSKGQRPFQPVRVKYGDASVSRIQREYGLDDSKPDPSFEAFGVIGLITVSKSSYLVTITRRQQVAQICGHPIYVVTEVAITPCTSKIGAEEAIKRTSDHISRQARDSGDESDSSEEEEVEFPSRASDEVEDAIIDDDDARPGSARSRVAEDVIRRRGSYGRFAQRWFSRSGWTLDQKRNMGLSNAPKVSETASTAAESSSDEAQESLDKVAPSEPELLPKLLRTAQVLFGSSRSFYFSYDFDLTRSLDERSVPQNAETPLHNQVDEVFFWNRNLLQPFTSSGQDCLALPLMQGFVGQKTFIVDNQPPQSDDKGRSPSSFPIFRLQKSTQSFRDLEAPEHLLIFVLRRGNIL